MTPRHVFYIIFLFGATILEKVRCEGEHCVAGNPALCPFTNGVIMDCIYHAAIIGGCGCWRCYCPTYAPDIPGHGCVPLPTRIGQSCLFQNNTLSCYILSGVAVCDREAAIPYTCQCLAPWYVPSDDMTECIPKPVQLGDRCTRLAKCEDNIPNAICGEEGQCVCEPGTYPNVDER